MIVISYSGGKDSTAMLLLAIEMKLNFYAVYQDTGFENSLHYKYLDYIEEKTEIKIHRVKSIKYNGMIDMIEKKNAIPNRIARFCTDNLKTDAMKRFIKDHNDVNEIWVGVRQQESEARAKRYADLTFDDTFPPLNLSTVLKPRFWPHRMQVTYS